jgi:hypothetical protein
MGDLFMHPRIRTYLIRRCFLLGIFILLFKPHAFCSNKPKGGIAEISDRMHQFMQNWLIEGNVDSALKYFNEGIFSSKAMYCGECASFGAMEIYKGNNKKAIRGALEWYTKELSHQEKILIPNKIKLDPELHPLNNPENDGFFIFSDLEFQKPPLSQVEKASKQLRSMLKGRPFFLVLLPLKVAPCYFIWINNHDNWEILHAETYCDG